MFRKNFKSVNDKIVPSDDLIQITKNRMKKISADGHIGNVDSRVRRPIVQILAYVAGVAVMILVFISLFYFFPKSKMPFAANKETPTYTSVNPTAKITTPAITSTAIAVTPTLTAAAPTELAPIITPTVIPRDRSQSIFTYNSIVYFPGDIYWGPVNNPQERFDQSDLVLIVTPTIDYMDTTPLAPFNFKNVKSEEVFNQFTTVRNLDVIQVIKGENVPANIDATESFGMNNELYSEGKPQLLLLYDYVVPMRAGMKYVVFITKNPSTDRYGVYPIYGKFNIDGKDTDEINIKTNEISFQDFKYKTLNLISPMTTIPIINNGILTPTPTPPIVLSDWERFLTQFDTAMYFYGPIDAAQYKDFTKEQDFAYFMRELDRRNPNFDRLSVIVYFSSPAIAFSDSKYLALGYTVKSSAENDLAGLNAYIVTIPDRYADPARNVGDAAREIYADVNVARMKPILTSGVY